MSDKMELVLEPGEQDVAVVRITGRLDFASAAEARSCFAGAVAEGHPKLIIDLSQTDFVDSAGLGALISGMRTSRQAGGDLRIVNPNEQVKMLLSLTSLDQVLATYPTIEEALDGFS